MSNCYLTKCLLFFLVLILMMSSCKVEKVKEVSRKIDDGMLEVYFVLKSDTSIKEGVYFRLDSKNDTLEKCFYVNNQLDGQRILYYPNGQVKIIENYIKGQFNGPYLQYFENGTLKQTANYENGEMNGELKNYYEDPYGQIKESFFLSHGIENGPYKKYYENGQIEEEGIYKEGLKDGEFKEYYENGILHAEGKYLGDFEDGDVKVYDSTGVLSRVYVFENKKIIETIKPDKESH